jgi:hypothetical protein
MRTTAVCGLVVLTALLAGCGGDHHDPPSLTSFWYQPRVGGSWVYRDTATATERGSSPGVPETFTMTVVLESVTDTTTVPGHTCWVMTTTGDSPGVDPARDFLEVAAGQVRSLATEWFYMPGSVELHDPPKVGLTGAATVGNTWVSGETRWTVSAIGQTVTVPAGTFPGCVELTAASVPPVPDGGGFAGTTWYAPRVGMVKQHATWTNSGTTGDVTTYTDVEDTTELTSYPR